MSNNSQAPHSSDATATLTDHRVATDYMICGRDTAQWQLRKRMWSSDKDINTIDLCINCYNSCTFRHECRCSRSYELPASPFRCNRKYTSIPFTHVAVFLVKHPRVTWPHVYSNFVGYCSIWIGLLYLYSVPCYVKFVNYTNGSAGHRAQAAKHPTSMTESVLYLIGELNATVLTKDQQYSISQTAVSWMLKCLKITDYLSSKC